MVTVSVPVRPDNPVFAGHFPGFPILPGVFVVESVRAAAVRAIPHHGQALALLEIESARFLEPVLPGDTLAIDLSWSRDGTGFRCAATVSTGRGRVAKVRLRLGERSTPSDPTS